MGGGSGEDREVINASVLRRFEEAIGYLDMRYEFRMIVLYPVDDQYT